MKQLSIAFAIIIIFIFYNFNVHSQDFKAGLFAGIVPSQVDGDMQGGFHKLGVTAGAFVNRSLKTGKIQGELAFTTKGSKASRNDVEFNHNISLYYIDLSLYYIIGLWGDNLFLRAGLVPSILVHSEQSGIGVAITADVNSSTWRRFSTALSAGLDYWFSKSWYLNVTYNYSAFSIQKDNLTFWGLRPAETNAYYNNYIIITLAYQF